eukprot:3671399-Prymnesium_polylepis.1
MHAQPRHHAGTHTVLASPAPPRWPPTAAMAPQPVLGTPVASVKIEPASVKLEPVPSIAPPPPK